MTPETYVYHFVIYGNVRETQKNCVNACILKEF